MSLPLIAGIAVLVLIIGIAISQRSGPRVTKIDRVVKREDEDERS
ncbi:MAG: hypothetical protein ABIQ32_13280 [Sphingomicrobium sp.]